MRQREKHRPLRNWTLKRYFLTVVHVNLFQLNRPLEMASTLFEFSPLSVFLDQRQSLKEATDRTQQKKNSNDVAKRPRVFLKRH